MAVPEIQYQISPHTSYLKKKSIAHQKGNPLFTKPYTKWKLRNVKNFTKCVKFQVRSKCQSQIIELEPRPPLKKAVFSGQILMKLRL